MSHDDPDTHPSTAADGPHLTVNLLADLDEGLLDAAATPGAEAHAAGCRACADLLTAVRTVRTDLAALPPPVIPADVAGRIDRALAAEAASGTGVIRLARGAGRADAAGRRSGPPAWLAAAAVVAVIGAGVVTGVQALRPSGVADTVSSAAGAASPSATPESAPRSAGASALARLDAAGRSLGDRNYDARSLDAAVRRLLRSGLLEDFALSRGPTAGQTGAGTSFSAAADAARLERCLAAADAGAVAPLLIEDATYLGEPTLVIVLPAAGNFVEVVVTAASCSSAADIRLRRLVTPPGGVPVP